MNIELLKLGHRSPGPYDCGDLPTTRWSWKIEQYYWLTYTVYAHPEKEPRPTRATWGLDMDQSNDTDCYCWTGDISRETARKLVRGEITCKDVTSAAGLLKIRSGYCF